MNDTKKDVYTRHQAANSGMIVIEPDFEPDPHMNDEYFLPDKAI